ncbi:MAG: hypothetical protein A2X32_12750 [Elusimicrobia bacterium GWC2_64_44]|nr:MAG: hypothetical protein A2X32_12750 [Elusimicrobia bacterium GWC2_64_44]
MNRLAALLFFCLAAAANAGGAGSDALAFLKIDAGARGAAMSGAYAAAGDDALSVFYNPAGTALIARKEVLLGHNEWLEGLRNEIAAYAQPLGPRLTAFAGANLLLSGRMDRYVVDQAGDPQNEGYFNALEGAFSVGLSGKLREDFYGGAALKALTQQAAGGKALGWAGDAGFVAVSGPWRVGASASNVGGQLKLGSKSFSAPAIIRGGASFRFLENYLVAADVVKAGRSETAGALGAEASFLTGPKEYFLLRAGYKTGRSRFAGPGVTAGVGVASRDVRVDYAFAPYGDLGAAHRVTVSLKFGAVRPEEMLRSLYGDRPKPRMKKIPRPKEDAAKKENGKKPEEKKGKKDPGEVYFMW